MLLKKIWNCFMIVITWLVFISSCNKYLRDPPSYFSSDQVILKALEKDYHWTEEWYNEMPIDHFSFSDNRTFSLRYLMNIDYYVPEGPILFYTGNEGSIEGFAVNTGFMWDLAKKLSAAVIFAEHRFYGKSQPFGNESYATVHNLGYLSSEQALADFAQLIRFLKENKLRKAKNSLVVAFGGSYGGMLSAWLRLKYPHIVVGAVAASAPVFWFPSTSVPEDIYDRIVTRSFVNSGCVAGHITKAWMALENLTKTDEGRNYLNNLFHLEQGSTLEKPSDALLLKSFIREVFESMAMVNYPYPTEFLVPLPGWPVKVACGFFNSTGDRSDEQLAHDMYSITNLFYNFTGSKPTFCINSEKCNDSAFSALGNPLGWPWQACTEMTMQMCASGPPNDFFWKDCPFTVEGVIENCKNTFGKIGYSAGLTRPNWALTNYGQWYPSGSNIIFSNGYLDPWSGGGWSLVPKTTGTLVSIIIEDGAHHYDLRGSDPRDTEAVKDARRLEEFYIKKWIKQGYHGLWKTDKKKHKHKTHF